MSNSSFITPRNRAAAASEEAFKKRVQTSMPSDSTTVVVFTDPISESLPELNGDYYLVRVYSEGGHHSHLLDPRQASNKEEFRRRVLQLPQATLEADNEFVSQLTNLSIWKAFVVGEKKNLFSLISVERTSSYSMNFTEDGSISKLMKNGSSVGGKEKLSEFKREEGQTIEFTYDEDKKVDLEKPHYKSFFEELKKRLSETSFEAKSININSLTRTANSQARAMVSTRFYGSKKTLDEFRSWVETTYKDGVAKREIKQIVNKDWTDPMALRDALEAQIQNQISRGIYISKHLQSGAADLRTNNLSFSDVKILLEVLKQMKNDGWTSFYNWEHVWDYVKNQPQKGEAKREAEGSFNKNEHIHLQLTKSINPGE